MSKDNFAILSITSRLCPVFPVTIKLQSALLARPKPFLIGVETAFNILLLALYETHVFYCLSQADTDHIQSPL